MASGDLAPIGPRHGGPNPAVSARPRPGGKGDASAPAGWIIETVVSPFHCLYQDALEFHKQSHLRLPRSEAEASRLARAAFLLYVESGSALVHQAAVELGRPDLAAVLADPEHPLALADVWRLLPGVLGDASISGHDPKTPPWPQFAEVLALRDLWTYPGSPSNRRAYYHSPRKDGSYEPLQAHQSPPELGLTADFLRFPLTGLPRDPYALRPRDLDTVRGILDSAIDSLDRRLSGLLTRDARHRKEPVRMVYGGE
jgi:hypothetical protein